MSKLSRRSVLKGIGASAVVSLPAVYANAAEMKFDKSYDVVIVGAGGAGLAAACRSDDLGLKAVVLEKVGLVGGSSLLCGGQYSTFGTDFQKEKGLEDSADNFYNDMLKTGAGKNDPSLVRAYVNMSRIQYDFLTKTLDVHPRGVVLASGMSTPRAHPFKPSEVISAMAKYAKEKGAEIILNAPVTRLIRDPETDKIIGVKATIDKQPVNIEAKKGVILATGGFSRNPELLAKFNPVMARADAISGAGTQGDGMLMAQAVGADTTDMSYIKASYGFKLNPTRIEDMHLVTTSGAIMINKNGKRFVNESFSYKLLGDAALAQPDGISFQVFDKNILESVLKNHPQRTNDLPDLAKDPSNQKWVFTGNTIEEAAQKAGLDPKVVAETVAKYNKDIADGKEDELNRTSITNGVGKPIPINNPPFYIMPSTAALIGTYCGVKTNDKAQVLNVYGEVIPGLYAAGEVMGGVHGAAYMTGTAFGKAICFGRIAVDTIAGVQEK